MRASPSANKPGKQKHFLYIDGSVAFGEGLNDDETTTHWINLKSKTYEAYAIGYLGYQDQHTWLQFEQGDLPQKVKQKKGRALLISYEYKMDLLAASLQALPNIVNSPNIHEDKNGKFHYLGNFAETTTFFNKFLIFFCFPLPACKNFIFTRAKGTDEDELDEDAARLARLYASINKFYRDQFDVDEFAVGWIGSNEGLARIRKHLTIPFFKLPDIKRYQDDHPTPEGAKVWADFILKNVLKD